MGTPISRRRVLQAFGAGALTTQLPAKAFAANPAGHLAKQNSGEWQTWKIKSTITPTQNVTALLVPLPKQTDTTYQKSLSMQFSGNFESVQVLRDPTYEADGLLVNFSKKDPRLEMMTTVQTRDRTAPEPQRPEEDLKTYLKPTPHMPVDGLVAQTAHKIAQGLKSADAKARAFHHWIVDNTFRDPKVRGCGVGDINAILASGNLGGKCADLNSLFVGFCRASGIPAREVYGMRVGESKQFKCLGKSGMVSKAQHCRAEYFSPGQGWVAVDSADVRKVILEENLTLKDPKVQAIRDRFFGFWEMNWIAFNSGRDFKYPQTSEEMNFLMYPQSLGASIDSLDPDKFKYTFEVLA